MFDVDRDEIGRFLSDRIPDFGTITQIRKFETGQSNPTFHLETDGKPFVLRAKPKGQLLKSAHQVDREFRVMRALAGTAVKVPKAHILCEEPNPLGVTFMVMEYVEGHIFWDPALPDLAAQDRSQIYANICETIAALHMVKPADVGLSDFGAPGNYFARQLGRWTKQYNASEMVRNDDVHWLCDWLSEHLPPEDGQLSIVHGDYRIDNLIFEESSHTIAAILDWELSTLGHPMADVSYQAMQWRLPNSGRSMGLAGVNRAAIGIPTEQEYLARYCELRGIQVPQDWDFYLTFSYFRLIAILQGVIRRAVDGNASNPKGVEGFRAAIPILVSQAIGIAKGP